MSKYIIVKLQEMENKNIFKVFRERKTHYRGVTIRMISDFQSEIIQAGGQGIISLNC